MIIGTCGFGSTGSSAVSDYLMEFDNVQVLDRMEFTWVSSVDGLIDLDYHLNHPHDRTRDSIRAISRFLQLAKNNRTNYALHGLPAEAFDHSVREFIDSITQVEWKWDIGQRYRLRSRHFLNALVRNRLIPWMEVKLGHRINCWPMEQVRFSIRPDNFDIAARRHVKELLTAMGADFSRPVVLDQPFSGNNPQACFKFYEDPYAIVVDRDPRDNYVFANTKLLGMHHFMPIQPVEDFVKYYRALRDKQPYQEKHERVLSIKFEDMVYHYDETTQKIRNFLHLSENPHPKSIFNPAVSMPNTQVWKRFPQYAQDIAYIEKELSEYLFDYTGCPEPDANGTMFRGRAHKRI